MRVDHRPRQVRRADDELGVAERPELNEWTSALVATHRAAVHAHGQSRYAGRQRYNQVMVARLGQIFMFGPRPASEPGPASECLAVQPQPARLDLEPLEFGQPIPGDTGLAEVVLQGFVKWRGEGISSTSDGAASDRNDDHGHMQ
jgi:hypothetical protein